MLTKVGCDVSIDNSYVVHRCKSAAYLYYVLHNKLDRMANHPFYHFRRTIVYVILQGARFCFSTGPWFDSQRPSICHM